MTEKHRVQEPVVQLNFRVSPKERQALEQEAEARSKTKPTTMTDLVRNWLRSLPAYKAAKK